LDVDSTAWSGEGTFTQAVLDRLKDLDALEALKVEDAPATRSDADYNFISNEIFVKFRTIERREPARRFGLPVTRRVIEKLLTIEGLARILDQSEGIGGADYQDASMIQYLRTERIVPPYQTRGYKLVELLRIYEAGTTRTQD
jgi:hypothetical protein